MTGAVDPRWASVDAYLAPLVGEDDVLANALSAAEEAGLPPIHVSAAQGRLLQLLAQVHGARRVLEVGTLGGYSTIWLTRGLSGPDRHVTTLEISERHADVARRTLDRAGLGDVVDVVVGPAAESLERLAADGVPPYDLVFIDADKPSNTTYLEWALRLVRPGAVVVVDNVVRGGAVARADTGDGSVDGSRAVIERVAADPRLSGTVVQTVGEKGYDGFLLVRVGD